MALQYVQLDDSQAIIVIIAVWLHMIIGTCVNNANHVLQLTNITVKTLEMQRNSLMNSARLIHWMSIHYFSGYYHEKIGFSC
jgi:hypothetical protein